MESRVTQTMSNYDVFAAYYDSLTKNVDYAGRADYIVDILRKHNHSAGITLDLACGTGSLTLELFKRGLDVYGIDGSSSMLMVAKDKAYDMQAEILFLCQKMQNIDLYGTVDTVVCALDSINHLPTTDDILAVFKKVSLFMNPGGYFIFDFNTIYKHKFVLSDKVYVYDTKDVYCVWQNKYKQGMNRVDISLDFFEKTEKLYSRSREHFSEITCSDEAVCAMLKESGFSEIDIYDDMSFDSPKEDTQRLVFVAKKG